jgi:hypothetical protein
MEKKIFRVVWEIELDADTSLEAAKTAQEWISDSGGGCQYYYVQDVETHEIVSVDLDEDDDNAVLPVKEYQALIK